MSRRWLITGVSGGLGRALAVEALARGDRVAGTLRRNQELGAFSALAPGRAFPILLDVTDPDPAPAIEASIRSLGGLDVVVNNAGYALIGAVEDISMEEARLEVETNFFGTAKIVKAVLPFLRNQGRGHIVNVASVGGAAGIPLFAYYCASKFAVVGFTAALAKEVASFGIRATAIEPGGLPTNFGRSSLHVAADPSPPYAASTEDLAGKLSLAKDRAQNDLGRAAAAIIALTEMADPPVHAAFGPDGLKAVRAALEARLSDYARAEGL
jgi:NAD(P)-dependent dehydrogenase (short-subunit alcohol dehydrogenase family)